MFLDAFFPQGSARQFLEQSYLKQPFSFPGGCHAWATTGSWDTLEAALESSEADVLVVREGKRWPVERPPTVAEARQLAADGYTLLVRHVERHHPQIAELAAGFAESFAAPVDVHLYCTPGGTHGFGWHYDAEDVFILQTAGSKEYQLRKNTVNPWPLVETLPADMRYERELMPLMRCRLEAGDWLYIPNGYWHRAEADEEAISLAVGVLSTSAFDLYQQLRSRLLDSLRWRQRLPCAGTARIYSDEDLIEQYQTLAHELAADLTSQLTGREFLEEFIAACQPHNPTQQGRGG